MAEKYIEIRDSAKNLYEKAKYAGSELGAARAKEQKAAQAASAAYYQVEAAESRLNSAQRSDDPDAVYYAQNALYSARSNYMAAQAAYSNAAGRARDLTEILKTCIRGFEACIFSGKSEIQKLSAAEAKLSALSSNRYANLQQTEQQIQSMYKKYNDLNSLCEQCIQFIRKLLNEDDDKEKILVKTR